MNLTELRDIKALLARHGFRFSKSMGQNFLIADWVPRDIAEAAGLDESCAVLEIGPGIGCLTRELAGRAGKVVSVELDRSLLPILFFISYLAGRMGQPEQDKVLRGILVCTCLLSLFAFWHVGIPNLVPDRVVLP